MRWSTYMRLRDKRRRERREEAVFIEGAEAVKADWIRTMDRCADEGEEALQDPETTEVGRVIAESVVEFFRKRADELRAWKIEVMR